MPLHPPELGLRSLDASVLERRSIRHFRPDPVPRRLVAEVLELACWAPSPHNSQPWRFTVLFDPSDRSRLASAMADRLESDLRAQGASDDEIRRQSGRSRARISAAPVVILCSLTGDGLVPHADERMRALEWSMAVQSVGTVLQSIFLLAHERRLGTCWMAAPMYCPDVVRTVLALPPCFEPQALVLMGFVARDGKRRERRSPDEVIDLR
jgi:F420 biosynthesis protein FbiB-like protein